MAITPIVPATYAANLTTTLGGTPVAEYGILIPPESSVHYSAGLDISTNEGDSFTIGANCTSSFGSSGSTLTLDLNGGTYTGLFVHAGSGTAYVTPGSAIARTRKIGPGDLYGVGGTWAVVEHSTGLSSFNDTADVQTAYVFGGVVSIDEHASDTVDAATVGAGATLNCKRTIVAATIKGGKLFQTDRTATITTLTIDPGGYAYHAGGNITTLNGYASGTLDLSGCSGNVVIATGNIFSKNFKIIPPPPPYSVAITTPNYFGDATVLDL